MSRIIDKLVQASGGWEHFLYQTLKDVCKEVDLTDVDSSTAEVVLYAKDVLKAYEEIGAVDTGVDEKKVQPVPVVSKPVAPQVTTQKTHTLKPSSKVESVEDVKQEAEVPKPRPVPRMLTAKIAVDNEVGASQGGLPIPFGHVIVNRENLVITTANGAQLGRGSFDGQIRGSDVSGHIRVDGTYRLVFKDVNCSFGIVKFEVVATVDPQEDKEGVSGQSK